MRVVISGGLGYVGGRLSKYFAEQGHEVIALSRQAEHLSSIEFPDTMRVVHPDTVMADKTIVQGSDVFIHLAAMNENDCMKYPLKAIEVNITGTLQWLNVAKEAGIGKFMYFSTAHVYGKPLEGYFDENTLTRPVHPYAITHKAAEDYVLAYAADNGMTNTVIRLTNAFGGPAFPTADRWTLLVNDLCQSVVRDGKMTLHGDGLQQRDFVCLSDVCAATVHMARLPEDTTKGEIFNMGGNHSLSVWDMALKVKFTAEELLGAPVQLNRKNPTQLDVSPSLQISIDKLLMTGFVPRVPVIGEIQSTLEYFLTLKAGGHSMQRIFK